MTNKEFDKWLRESLSSVRSEQGPQDWDRFVGRVEESESQMDSGFDTQIRDAMAGLGAGLTPDWPKMEEILNADERQFDQQIKETVENFEVPYNPATWPTLHARVSAEEKMRRRFIHVKVLEIAAVLILFLTFYNFFPVLKSSVLQQSQDLAQKEVSNSGSELAMINPAVITAENAVASDGHGELKNKNAQAISSGRLQEIMPTSVARPASLRVTDKSNNRDASVALADVVTFDESRSPAIVASLPLLFSESVSQQASPLAVEIPAGLAANSLGPISRVRLASVFSPMVTVAPVLKKASRMRFGMMAGADINTLFVPDEHFYSQGRYINFSEKEIVAGGYSAGASLLFDSRRVVIETGVMYSSKSFRPDRNLFVGNSLDQHSLDFENISLNVLSVPLYFHWKIDGRGLWRVYATSGISLHVIASAHYDLITETIYTSSAVQDPTQMQNRGEVERLRENMLDGAKFSSKGYITTVGGFGIERSLNSRMSLFIQPMYEYQIPFFGLIEQNGKHQQNGSLLLGTRISL